MEIYDVEKRVRELSSKSVISDEEEFELIECLKQLIEEGKDYRSAEYLGGIYYDKKMYDLALKYYELAKTLGSIWAYNGLGYIWYYGRTGQVDYQKAYENFKAMADYKGTGHEFDRLEARFKLADMYKNGYYVEKSWDKYVEIIEQLYEEVCDDDYLPRPEVFTRLASIRMTQGRNDEALELLLTAKRDLISRLAYNRFFGDLSRMKWLTGDLYKLIEFDYTDFDLYDLYYLLAQPHLVSFRLGRKTHEIESFPRDGEMNIRLDEKWFRNITDFFIKAIVDDKTIEAQYWAIAGMKLER